jgi:hypothetical protein
MISILQQLKNRNIMIPAWCIDVLMKIQPEDKARLNSFGVDRFKVGDDYDDCKGNKNVCLLDGA